jgi:prolipoprotein diacylglyceryl transferase
MTMAPTYFPSPPQGVWHLGPLPIRAYALFIIAGIVVALVIGDRRWAARGGQRGVIYDIALWVVPFGLIGGRLYHLATDWRTYWGPGGAGLGAAVRIWDGGLGIWGAVALGVLGAWIGCRRHGIPLPAFVDAVAPGIILAQAIGRLGNYFNQELYGRETTLPWGLEIFYRRDPSGYIDPHSLDGVSTGQLAVVVQPTFLYELIWNVVVFAILIYIDRRYAIGHGRLFATYVALYCVGRFWVELMRDDTATHIAGIRINTFTSTFVFIGAVVYFVLAPKGREDPESLRGKDDAADAEAEPDVESKDELASVAAVSATAAAASADDDAGSAASAEFTEPTGTDEPEPAETEAVEAVADAPAAEPEPEQAAPEAEESEAEAPEAEEPEVEAPEVEAPEVEAPETEPEAEEPDAVVPELVAPEVEAAAEPDEVEADETEAEEPETPEPAAEEPATEEPAAEDPAAEEPDAESATAEPETEASEVQDAEETPHSEPDSKPAADGQTDEPAGEQDAAEAKPEGDGNETRRRWPLRRRTRR